MLLIPADQRFCDTEMLHLTQFRRTAKEMVVQSWGEFLLSVRSVSVMLCQKMLSIWCIVPFLIAFFQLSSFHSLTSMRLIGKEWHCIIDFIIVCCQVFYDHFVHNGQIQNTVTKLVKLRKQLGLHCRSSVDIVKAENDVYVAEVRLGSKILPYQI